MIPDTRAARRDAKHHLASDRLQNPRCAQWDKVYHGTLGNRVTDIRLLENSCVWVRCREFQMVLHLLDPYRVCVRLATYPLKLF